MSELLSKFRESLAGKTEKKEEHSEGGGTVPCPFCHAMTMKLISIAENGKYYRCNKCDVLMKQEN